uniref:15 kDa n=1 Tax=Polytomella sp. Pringsheim 198.80 TaxID=37502 RepID=UPI001E1E23B7|nr:Chain e, kDa [Polytomella sp. Pringsheim 198.80]7ARD_e Chain e, kDa [Polytomella sp. Pringsheim 198.80]|eukprot:CAMPEP_0175056000 /NCGR_PEP_ID=MMETSP0052_2-20121109/10413_1 /TAXON_ID=51329 ORGANISM="Polytomella parva, Strain SAG 63-3" /NCGR_SAMPLE_ID=MMETSP0052_2 /ASSEMBLY_ACC=CAM_ASM_000194 /LENGTH=75 /DNA_ID=CAMNT_0016320949 /DNA_START=40 /DNA_END=267 /DNA_ORIENTATION=+
MSGFGLQSGTARCYDWYMDYLKCMDESKAPMITLRKQECSEWLEDYNECLHRDKLKLRKLLIEREKNKQEAASSS